MENTSSGKHMLPEDFVKKQRAYFEEVDAFELPEEEASETDLEWRLKLNQCIGAASLYEITRICDYPTCTEARSHSFTTM